MLKPWSGRTPADPKQHPFFGELRTATQPEFSFRQHAVQQDRSLEPLGTPDQEPEGKPEPQSLSGKVDPLAVDVELLPGGTADIEDLVFGGSKIATESAGEQGILVRVPGSSDR